MARLITDLTASGALDGTELVWVEQGGVPRKATTQAIADLSTSHDAVTLAGSLDYLTLSGQEITRNAIVLTTDVSGVLPEANGGTNQSTYTTGDLLYASAANTLAKLGAGTSGDVLTANGAGVAPSWQTPSSLPTGTTTDATLRWSGSAWVEETSAQITTAGLFHAPNGSAAGPSFAFEGDTDNGLYYITTDVWGLSAAGAEQARVEAGGIRLIDNKELRLGTAAGGDAQMYFNGTDTYLDVVGSTDFVIRAAGGSDTMARFYGNAGVSLYYDNTVAFQTRDRALGGASSSIVCYDHGGNILDVGFNELPDFNWNTSDTLEAQHAGHITGHNDTARTADMTITLDGGTDFLIDGVVTLFNGDDTWDIDILLNGRTLYVNVPGTGLVSATTCSIGPGGVATLRRESTTDFHIFGTEITYT